MKRSDIDGLRPDLVAAAQSVLDDWDQDENGFDEVLGEGGACGLVADAMSDVLSRNGVISARVDTDFEGGHEFIVILIDEGVHSLDIPAGVYETGAGYKWEKRAGVTLSPDDISIFKVREPVSENEFLHEYCDEPLESPGP